MALIIILMLTYGLILGAIGLTRSSEQRMRVAKAFRNEPLESWFVTIWLFFGYLFFVGIFVPLFGEIELLDTGWELWKIGGLGGLACWIATWFWDPRKNRTGKE